MHDTPSKDRRVQKTRTQLLGALGSLMHEKPYDAIAIKEILYRANVGRSTFYTHFRDKDELLSIAMRELLQTPSAAPLSRAERLLRFSLPVFHHVDQHRREAGGRGRQSHASLHQRLEREIAGLISAEVRSGLGARAPKDGYVPPELLICHVTSTFTTVLNWWVESGSRLDPSEVDQLFRALVLPALVRALD